jgi:hypothetical protein
MMNQRTWTAAIAIGAMSVTRATWASESVTVVEVAPAATSLEPDKLRALIANELHTDVVAPDDPRAGSAKGTVFVDVDAQHNRLSVRYVAHRAAILRQVPLPKDSASVRSAVVVLAGNLARDEASDLAAELRRQQTPTPAPRAPESQAATDADAVERESAAIRLRATLDYYAQRDHDSGCRSMVAAEIFRERNRRIGEQNPLSMRCWVC